MIALGFGCVEEEEQQRIKRFLIRSLLEGKSVYDVSAAWNVERKPYDKMSRDEAPERYTTFYVYDNEIHYHHINRRHPFSPDGWALLQVTEPLEEEAKP